jgi:outer membrane protein
MMWSVRRPRIWILTAALLGATALSALPAHAETIGDALSAAYRSNPQILAERARQRATDEGVPRALSNWRPTVTFSTQGGKGEDEIKQGDVTATRSRTPYLFSLNVRQPLYRGGRTLAETSRAENLVQRGRALLQTIEQQVLVDAAAAYANLLRDQAVLDLQTNNEQVLTRQLGAARDRFQVGEITKTDVAQAEARLSRARADRILAEGNVAASRANYLRVIGEAPGRLAPATPPVNLPTSEQMAQNVAQDNPTIVAARFAERAALDDVDLVAGELLPTLSLNGELSRQNEITQEEFKQDKAEIQAVLSVPLYQAGSVEARVREAKQTAGQRRIEIEDQRRRTREDVTRNWEALVASRARVVAFQTQIRANEIALEGVEQEARVGSRTTLDVLDAEQELLDARVNLVRAQRDEVVAAYQVAQAIGKLTARDLSLPVEIYDPSVYYTQTRGRWIGTSTGDEQPTTKPTTR